MKKNIFLAAAACCICFCASAFNSKKVARPIATDKMEQSLTNEFGNHGLVEWKKANDNTTQAFLEVEGQQVQAIFNEDGEYVCSTMPMVRENLPLKLHLAINKKLPNVVVSAIIQMSSTEGTSYFFQTLDAKGAKIWKATANGDIELFKKVK